MSAVTVLVLVLVVLAGLLVTDIRVRDWQWGVVSSGWVAAATRRPRTGAAAAVRRLVVCVTCAPSVRRRIRGDTP